MLRDLPTVNDPNLLIGADTFADAGVYRLDDETALVQSVDFFPPLVDDPYTFGRIAAANSLSDIYAMGARPLTALNIVGFPDKELPIDLLGEILKGGAERVAAAGAVVVGGHSVRDTEIKFGLAVTGLVHPRHMVTNAGAKPGDVLVLTKPIGSGVLTSAAKSGKLPEADLAEAIATMVELNAGACAAMLAIGVHAATDITGFGLIGHAREMADASEVTLEIEAAAVPLLEHTMRFAREGVVTRAHQSNLAFHAEQLSFTDIDETLLKVLADAQTSGGLLIAVGAERSDLLLAELGNRRTRAAAVIGRVAARSGAAVRLV